MDIPISFEQYLNIIMRVKTVEDFIGQNYPLDIKKIEGRIELLSAELSLLKESYASPIEKMVEQNVNSVWKAIDELSNKLHNLKSMPNVAWAKYNKMPFKCPVCEGTRICTSKEDMGLSWQCEPCEGKGIVWG